MENEGSGFKLNIYEAAGLRVKRDFRGPSWNTSITSKGSFVVLEFGKPLKGENQVVLNGGASAWKPISHSLSAQCCNHSPLVRRRSSPYLLLCAADVPRCPSHSNPTVEDTDLALLSHIWITSTALNHWIALWLCGKRPQTTPCFNYTPEWRWTPSPQGKTL